MWRPVVPSEQQGQVDAILLHIADRMVDGPDVCTRPWLAETAGEALFLAYASKVFERRRYAEAARKVARSIYAAMCRRNLSHALFGGLPGIIWAIDHVSTTLGDSQRHDSVAGNEVDELLSENLSDEQMVRGFDLISGLAGIGLYAVERGTTPSGRELFDNVVSALWNLREQHPKGMTWRSSAETLHPSLRPKFPDGCFNLGMAHGVPGVVAVLAEALRRKLDGSRVTELLSDGVHWLLEMQRHWTNELSVYGYVEGDPREARAAWCYGDPGVFVALLRAAMATGQQDWFDAAKNVGQRIVLRGLQSLNDSDPYLCHGTSGVLHILNAAYHATGDEAFRHATHSMLNKTLQLCQRSPGVPTSFWCEEDSNTTGDLDRFGYLVGAAGTGLSLLTARFGIDPEWDAPLLVGIHAPK